FSPILSFISHLFFSHDPTTTDIYTLSLHDALPILLPVGLPLLCDQGQRTTSANCDQQMASHMSGRVVAATTHATPCANSAFCARSEEHTSELQSLAYLVCRLLLEKKKNKEYK